MDPTSSVEARTLYAGTDFGVFKTSDGGNTWTGPAAGLGAVPRVRHLIVDTTAPSRVYAAAAPEQAVAPGAGLYRSEDGGKEWVRLGAGKFAGVRSLSLCGAAGRLYAIAFRDGAGFWAPCSLWRSDDRGANWTELDGRLGAAVAVSPQDPDRVYYMTFAADVTREKVNVYRSLNGGKAWTGIADELPLSPGGDGNRIVFDPNQPRRFFVLHNSGTFEAIE